MSLTKVNNRMIESAFMSVKDFGAVGDGVTDDTTAIGNAEAAAYADGQVLLFPPGTYLHNGPRTYRCSISGYGATLKNSIGSEQTNNAGSALIRYDSYITDKFVEGITIDPQSYSTGMSVDGGVRIKFRDCRVVNALNCGIFVAYGTDVVADNCSVSGVKYAAAGLIAADGFYFAASTDCGCTNCYAENFERIGFVSEGESTNDSYRIRFISCVARNGNNCDRSPTEYNAGFWCENTNGSFLDNVTVTDMAGNAGQTSGRVSGIIITASGDSTDHVSSLTNFSVGDASGTLPVAISMGGTVSLANVVIKNGMIHNANKGISVGIGVDSATIDSISLNDMQYSSASVGGIVTDTAAGTMRNVSIRGVRDVNPTYGGGVTDVATINIYSANTVQTLNIDDCRDCSIAVRSGGQNQITVSNSDLEIRTTNYSGLAADRIYANNTIFRANGTNSSPWIGSSSPSGAQGYYNNCTFIDFQNIECGGASTLMTFTGCSFSECSMNWYPQTSGTFIMTGCTWINATHNASCITSNYYAASSADIFSVTGCYFKTDATKVAIAKHASGNPDDYIIQSNIFGANAAITSFTGGTSVVADNIQY